MTPPSTPETPEKKFVSKNTAVMASKKHSTHSGSSHTSSQNESPTGKLSMKRKAEKRPSVDFFETSPVKRANSERSEEGCTETESASDASLERVKPGNHSIDPVKRINSERCEEENQKKIAGDCTETKSASDTALDKVKAGNYSTEDLLAAVNHLLG